MDTIMTDPIHVVCTGCNAINRIPCLMLFRNGKEIARQAGAMGAADLGRWTRANI